MKFEIFYQKRGEMDGVGASGTTKNSSSGPNQFIICCFVFVAVSVASVINYCYLLIFFIPTVTFKFPFLASCSDCSVITHTEFRLQWIWRILHKLHLTYVYGPPFLV